MPQQPPGDGQRNRAVACYDVAARHPFRLFIDRGSVVDFSYPADPQKSAIAYVGSRRYGVGKAVFAAGGAELKRDRSKARFHNRSAVCTGPNDAYGSLSVHYVMTILPTLGQYDVGTGAGLLSAYKASLKCAKTKQIKAVGFSLFAAGNCRGDKLEGRLRVAISAILKFEGYDALKEVHLCAFNHTEMDILLKIARDMGLVNTMESTEAHPAMIASMETRVISLMEEKFRQMFDLQVKYPRGLPCPKLFYLVEADAPSWRHPKEWAKNTGSVKLYLHFVCSHSLESVSDKCRIKLRYSRDWLKSIAPALNLSLDLLTIALGAGLGRECPLNLAKIKELDEWAKQLLGDEERSVFEEAKSRSDSNPDSRSIKSVQTLVATSLSCVAEKAASSNINWQSELVPVYDSVKKEPTFVKSRFASQPRYS